MSITSLHFTSQNETTKYAPFTRHKRSVTRIDKDYSGLLHEAMSPSIGETKGDGD